MENNKNRMLLGEVTEEELLKLTPGRAPELRLKRVDRAQGRLEAVIVEDLIEEAHPARAIWEMTGNLDLSGYHKKIRAVEGVGGRERTDPRVLLSLWLYALTQGVSSAREIERLCGYHPAYRWMCGLKKVNYHTLSSFRVDHKEALEEVFIKQLGVLSKEGVVDLEEVMHDGTKVLAQAGGGTFRREATLLEHLELAEKLVTELSDPRQGADASKRSKAAKERAVRERYERLKLGQQELEKVRVGKKTAKERVNARVSETEPEARVMKQGDGGFAPSYNVQITTDAKEKIILAVAATQSAGDARELMPAVARVEENVGEKPKQMVVDGGYTNRENIVEMAEEEVDLIGSLVDRTKQVEATYTRLGITKGFWREAFEYDEENNNFICPSNEVLTFKGTTEVPGATEHRYRAELKVCRACPFKGQCCPGSKEHGREIVRTIEAAAVTAFKEKMATDKAKETYGRRSEVAEFPNLWIKEKLGLRRFRLRGLAKVSMEATWACLTYDVQQWIRLIWRPRLKAVAAIA